jgi:hypothetical protein
MADWKRSIPRTELWGGCRACVHFRRDTTCVAFPDGIPIIIASGDVDHLVVRPGQVGDTVFEPRVAKATPGDVAAARSGRA